jgi:hypothetical protein
VSSPAFRVPRSAFRVPRSDDDDVPVRVGKYLCLDMSGPIQETFHEAFPAAECHGGLTHSRVEGIVNVLHAVGDL